jgi:hypothetical protein
MPRPFADVTSSSDPARIDAALMTAITKYDQRQARGRSFNPYALAHYCGALQDARARVAEGQSWRRALVQSFNGRLLDNVLKAIGEAPSTRDEQRF